jgi:hypothetical protein
MSDSLNATVIVRELVLTISANAELEPLDEPLDDEDPLEPPRLPAVALPPAVALALLEDVPDDEPLPDAVDVEPADTVSPGERLASETIVPLVGAVSLVFASAVSAFRTLAWAPYTAACAEAMLAGEGVVVVVVLVAVWIPPLALLPAARAVLEPSVRVVLGRDGVPVGGLVVGVVVLGLVRVGVVGPVLVEVVEVVVGVVVVSLVVPVCGVSETYSADPETGVKLALVAPEPVLVALESDPVPEVAPAPDAEPAVPFSTAVSWSSAAVRFFSAWSSESCATVGSSEASSWPSLTC